MARVVKAVYELLSPGEKRRAAGMLALMLVTAFFELVGVGSILPFLTIAVDPDIVHRNEALSWAYTTVGFEDLMDFIIFAGAVMLAIIVLMNLVSAVALWTQMRFVHNVGHAISTRLLDRYLAKPYPYFLTHHSSRLSRNILAGADGLVKGVLIPGVTVVSRSVVVLVVGAFLVVIEPVILLSVMVIIGGTYGIVYALIRRKLEVKGKRSVKANQSRFKTISEAFGGIKTIKVLGREEYSLRRYAGASLRYANYEATSRIYSQLPRYLVQTIAFGGFMISFIFLVASRDDLSQVIPLMGLFAVAAVRLLPRFQEFLQAVAQFRFHEYLLFEIHGELREQDERPVASSTQDSPPLPFDHELSVDRLRFRYPGTTKDVVRDLTLEIPKNSSVALVGTTGAGKTTLVDIILGLLVPDEGSITVDGTKITSANVRRWQKLVGYVPQEVVLADDTVANNIAYGLDEREINREAVEKAAKIAHIHEFIVNELPRGYETVIGERGVRISGGQRQRLGIAQALYRDPDVLVLDEATSDIDNVTEAHIAGAIQGLAGKKTLIIVAHRLATIERCERIFLLDEGKIVASGSYDELAAGNARFERMIGGLKVRPSKEPRRSASADGRTF